MISLIAAVAKNNVIGKANALPWHIPEDLKRFKQLTTGHVVLMGHKTFESILARLGKPLPERTNVVLTKKTDYQAPPGVQIYHDLRSVLAAYANQKIFVIGGGSIFEQTINLADELYITEVDQEVEGDVFFPEIDRQKWHRAFEESHPGFTFVHYMRRRVFTQCFGVVAAIVERNGKFLLMRESHNTLDKGKWNHPAGWIEPGQNPIESVKQEVREETGYEFVPTHLLGIYSLVRNDIQRFDVPGLPHAIKLVFLGNLFDDKRQPLGDDSAGIKWFTAEEIENLPPNELRDLDIKTMVQDYLVGKRYPLEILHHIVS